MSRGEDPKIRRPIYTKEPQVEVETFEQVFKEWEDADREGDDDFWVSEVTLLRKENPHLLEWLESYVNGLDDDSSVKSSTMVKTLFLYRC